MTRHPLWLWGAISTTVAGLVWLVVSPPGERGLPASDAPTKGTLSKVAGSESCRTCHPRVYAAWATSVHAKNMAPATAETVVGDFESNPVYRFGGTVSTMSAKGDRFFMEYRAPTGRTEKIEIAYVVGIKRHQVYLARREAGRLQVLPTYWNIEEQSWRDSVEGPLGGDGPLPTTAPVYWDNWGRTWNRACAECHASDVKRNFDPKTATYSTQYDPQINCESCHGPAGQHDRHWRTLRRASREAKPGEGGDMVPFADLSAQDGVLVCARCHAGKKVFWEGYEYGRNFYDYFMPDVWTTGAFFVDGRSSGLNYRFVDYVQSRCFQESGEKMDCGYCHPPHDLASHANEGVAESNTLCAQCHLSQKTRLTEHTHHGPQSDGSRCVECHMPEMALDLRMTVRDHTISSPLPSLTLAHGVPNACGNCHAEEGPAWAEGHVERWYGETPTYGRYKARVTERAQIIGAIKARRSVNAKGLVDMLEGPARSLIERASAAGWLHRVADDPAAFESLLSAARHVHPMVRYFAVESLGKTKDGRAIEPLRRALEDPRRTIRIRAYDGLLELVPGIRGETGAKVRRVAEEHRHCYDVARVDDPRARSKMALTAMRAGHRDEAERLLEARASLTPHTLEGYSDLFHFYLIEEDLQRSGEMVRAMNQLAPRSRTARFAAALHTMVQGGYAEAISMLETMIAAGQDSRLVQSALEKARAALLRRGPTP